MKILLPYIPIFNFQMHSIIQFLLETADLSKPKPLGLFNGASRRKFLQLKSIQDEILQIQRSPWRKIGKWKEIRKLLMPSLIDRVSYIHVVGRSFNVS